MLPFLNLFDDCIQILQDILSYRMVFSLIVSAKSISVMKPQTLSCFSILSTIMYSKPFPFSGTLIFPAPVMNE